MKGERKKGVEDEQGDEEEEEMCGGLKGKKKRLRGAMRRNGRKVRKMKRCREPRRRERIGRKEGKS